MGAEFKSDNLLVVDVDRTVRKFYASANAILSQVQYSSEMLKLYLVETFCLSVLSYSRESLKFNNKQLSQLNVCVGITCKAYRKIFNMHRWDSVKELIAFCQRLDFAYLYEQRKLVFYRQHCAKRKPAGI